ncbi:hypothetical protein HFP51_08830 [Parasphingopyxis sp. CP4]|uniref:hypothetical protein n=1 Tax=Parasphingopyxis sp. CP4 TaxID=2724527 RepID=UPI0015A33806|nr:hypothetical protein [Parasphingopyxis sp. CP4]QLC22270.1 hypothetical protein HFP51_08830 [Parasphingopyxis sp. CP4]
MEAFALALVITAIAHLLQYRTGLNLGDEGFLWNGISRISQGKIPVRDYKSYDPGRYYWCWIWMQLLGRGLLGVRHSAAIFQFFGLWAALWVLQSVTTNLLLLALAGIVLVSWVLPRHKVFEHAIALFTIAAALIVIRDPSFWSILFAGCLVGLAGFFGRNHGTYAVAGMVSVFGWMTISGDFMPSWPLVAAFGGGIIIGYSPMLLMWVFIPGMAKRYLNDKILVFIRRGGIDLTLAAPFPWRTDYRDLSVADKITQFLIGCHFIAVPAFYLWALAWIFLYPSAPDNDLLVAATLVGLFYTHHMVSRSDLPHLCQCMQPFLIGLFAAIYGFAPTSLSVVVAALLIAIAYLTTRQFNMAIVRLEQPEKFVPIEVGGDIVRVQKGIAGNISRIIEVQAERFQPEDGIFVAPMAAMMYPILDLQTPVRSDFMHFPEGDAIQESVIADLEDQAVTWALIQDHALDGRDELRFRNTHRLVWRYLCDRFEIVEVPGLGRNWQLMKRIGTG